MAVLNSKLDNISGKEIITAKFIQRFYHWQSRPELILTKWEQISKVHFIYKINATFFLLKYCTLAFGILLTSVYVLKICNNNNTVCEDLCTLGNNQFIFVHVVKKTRKDCLKSYIFLVSVLIARLLYTVNTCYHISKKNKSNCSKLTISFRLRCNF